MALDLIIEGGSVVDGTGRPAFRADVGVLAGRLVQVSARIREPARRRLDASNLVVAPGFIDSHTHLDAQLFWDPLGTPTGWHGATTVVMGNCGLSLAPLRNADPDYAVSLMAGVEQIPREILERNVPFGWNHFGGYVDALEASGLGVNAAAFAGYPLARFAAMGERAFADDAPTDVDLDQIDQILHRCLDEGALGITFNRGGTDHDDRGRSVAGERCAWADLERAAQLLSDRPGTLMAGLPGWTMSQDPEAEDRELEHWIRMCQISGRTFAWNPFNEAKLEQQLAQLRRANAAGARIIGLGMPHPVSGHISFELPNNLFADAPGWEFLFELNRKDRLRAMSDRKVRARLRETTGDERFVVYPERSTSHGDTRDLGPPFEIAWSQIHSLGAPPDTIAFHHNSLLDEARRQARHPVDVVLDAAVETELRAIFTLFVFTPFDAKDHLRVMTDPNVLVSGNDTGAHLMAACQTASSVLLGNYVRRMGLLSLEQAVQLLTAHQAQEFGLTDRGRIAPGQAADLVIFDPERIDALAPELLDDIPGGGRRFVQRAVGIEHLLVAGTSVLEAGDATGSTPGRFLGPGGTPFTPGGSRES